MLQHLLLVLIVPPLLLLGISPAAYASFLRRSELADRAERLLGRPLLAWPLAVSTLWVWHAPILYNLALIHEGVHIVQHLSFLVTATIFWWPVIAPLPERRRLGLLAGAPYLIAAGLVTSILGIILTFARPGLYPLYVHPVGSAAIVALVRQGWGLTPAADQQAGGVLMWVLSMPFYLCAAALVLARWYRAGDDEDRVDLVDPASAGYAAS